MTRLPEEQKTEEPFFLYMTNNIIYFLGIGGIGMSALAQYFLSEGKQVYGYDHTPSAVTDMLTKKGAIIHFDEDCNKIPAGIEMVIVTPAISRDNIEYQHFVTHQMPIFKRSQVLGKFSEAIPTIAVSGTHGKTTTTSMITNLLHPEIDILGFIGGIAKDFDSNFVLSKHPQVVVAEADEFDRSFLTLHPSTAIITAMDADHLDIYGEREALVEAFQQFADQVQHTLIVEEKIADQIHHVRKITYGIDKKSDYYAYNIDLQPNKAVFSLHTPFSELENLHLSANGLYNVLNATAAIAAVSEEARFNTKVKNMLTTDLVMGKTASYSGVKRRFDYITDRPDFIYIDDYAHHPEEMRSFLTAVRQIYPGKKMCGIFQPHLYSRTRDFADQFAEVLEILDQIILLPIYPAREEPIPGITSEYLLSLIHNPNKMVLQKEELIPYLKNHKPELLLTIGAGDIDRFIPIIKAEL